MQNDEVVRDIDIAIELESASECSCDPEVGWFCERCFVISTLEKARSLLTPRALDGLTVCENCGGWLKGGECENCNSPLAARQ